MGTSKYSGNAKISYLIYRIRNADGTYRLPEDNDSEESILEMELDIEGYSEFEPGNYYGPFEKCYPDSSDTEIIKATYNKEPFDIKYFTDKEEKEILCLIENEVASEEPDYPEPDDYYDYCD